MRFLLDVCVCSRTLRDGLVQLGHDVATVLDSDPRASDESVLQTAIDGRRILITEDKDFGELVHVKRLPHGPIIRVVGLSVKEQLEALRELLARRSAEVERASIVTVTRGRIRIRP